MSLKLRTLNKRNPTLADYPLHRRPLHRLTLTVEIILLVGILALAAVLRLTNVAENPAWYTDDATHIDIARYLLHGEVRYMAVRDSTLLFARPPLFHLLLAGILRFMPDSDPMLVLRTLTGALAVLSVALVYTVVRSNQRGPLALLAALALAIYPQAILSIAALASVTAGSRRCSC